MWVHHTKHSEHFGCILVQLLKITAMENWIVKWKPGQSGLSGTQRVHCFLLPTFISLLSSTIWLVLAIFMKTHCSVDLHCFHTAVMENICDSHFCGFSHKSLLGWQGPRANKGGKTFKKAQQKGIFNVGIISYSTKDEKGKKNQHSVDPIDILFVVSNHTICSDMG